MQFVNSTVGYLNIWSMVMLVSPWSRRWQCRLQMSVSSNTVHGQVNRYTTEANDVSDRVQFWLSRKTTYPLLSPLALDLISAPAYQALLNVHLHCTHASLGAHESTTDWHLNRFSHLSTAHGRVSLGVPGYVLFLKIALSYKAIWNPILSRGSMSK